MQAFGRTISPFAMMNRSHGVKTCCLTRWRGPAGSALPIAFGGWASSPRVGTRCQKAGNSCAGGERRAR